MTPLDLLKLIGPYALAALLGAYGAWHIQGVRLDAAHNELTAYKQAVTAEAQAFTIKTDQLNKDVSDAYAQNILALRKRFAAGSVLPTDPGQAPAISDPASSTDGSAPEPPTGARGITAPVNLQSCASDALQVLFLQHWILAIAAEE